MKNNFLKPDIKEAQQTINQIVDVDAFLCDIIEKYEKHNSQIDTLVKELLNFELERILSGIDIDEINRGKMSVRTSLLKGKGITNFLKVYKMQGVGALNRISGISKNSAYEIKNKVYNDAKKIGQGLYPRLDIENKNKYSNELKAE